MSNWKVLINDGFEESGQQALINAGFEIITQKIPQEDLANRIFEFDGIIIRSATKITREIISNGSQLKFIARAGVGLDNVDLKTAKEYNIPVLNTPGASSRSVAELAMSHLMTLTRSLQLTNRELKDAQSFSHLKKKLSNASEVKGKKVALLGFGRIGLEFAKMCIGLEMKVLVVDPFISDANISLNLAQQNFTYKLPIYTLDEALQVADYISIHAPFVNKPILDKERILKIKKGCILINTSRGENIDENALLEALENETIAAAGLDVFHHEPNIHSALVGHPKISISPHIAASTKEAQIRIAEEMVAKIINLKNT